ncbi:MAG: ABC transporter permease subunit, partial [Escherichia coli]|nr:ABC transporter permease subunit [Escherichia coli]
MSEALLNAGRQTLMLELQEASHLPERLGDDFVRAANIILHCEGKVVVSGIGKSGHIGKKIAATLASTGTPAFFVHPAEALHGDLGMSVATGRPVIDEVMTAVTYSLRLALLATAIGFVLGSLFGFVAGYFRNSIIDRLASVLSVFGVSVPHYWLGMLLVIVFSVKFALLPATGGGPIGEVGWQWDWEHLQFMLLPAFTLSVIPTGIIARTVRSQVADILSQEFIVGLRARGLNESRIFLHV